MYAHLHFGLLDLSIPSVALDLARDPVQLPPFDAAMATAIEIDRHHHDDLLMILIRSVDVNENDNLWWDRKCRVPIHQQNAKLILRKRCESLNLPLKLEVLISPLTNFDECNRKYQIKVATNISVLHGKLWRSLSMVSSTKLISPISKWSYQKFLEKT